jgi:hypothetical protein
MPSIRLRLPFYVLALLVSHLWKKSLIVDIGKKVNKALSFLTAFLASALLNHWCGGSTWRVPTL